MENEVLKEEKKEVEKTPIDKAIESQRVPLFNLYKKSKIASNFLTVFVLISAIAAMILITSQNLVLEIIGWVLVVAGASSMILYNILGRKKFEKNTRTSIAEIARLMNEGSFENENFKNVVVSDNKLELDDVTGNGAYVDIFRVASRHVCTGEYSSTRFTFAETAFMKKGEKKQPDISLFVGKYIDVLNKLTFKGNVIINSVGEKPIDPLNGLEGKTKLFEEDNFSIYGDPDFDYKKELGEQFINRVRKIKIQDHLLNFAISIWEGHTFVFLSYDDDVIAIPFDKPFNLEAFDCYRKQLVETFEALKYLGK